MKGIFLGGWYTMVWMLGFAKCKFCGDTKVRSSGEPCKECSTYKCNYCQDTGIKKDGKECYECELHKYW